MSGGTPDVRNPFPTFEGGMTDRNEQGLEIMMPSPERLLSVGEVAAIRGWATRDFQRHLNGRGREFPAPDFVCSRARCWRPWTEIRWIEDEARGEEEPIDGRRQRRLDDLQQLLTRGPGARGGLCA